MRKVSFILASLCLVASTMVAQKNILGMATSLDNDSLIYAAGFRLTGLPVSNSISPALSEAEFLENAKRIRDAKCAVYMCNILFPGTLKIAGPDVDEKKVLEYLDKVLERARIAGIKNLILGSGGARRLPDGYDQLKATQEFISLARKMAIAAKRFDVTIILENLNSTETNFINTLSAAASVVKSVAHPNLKLNADIYHMMKENESPEEIIRAGKYIVYCEIAEKQNRTLPGVEKDDFRPYLRALKEIRYKGPIMIEGRSDNLERDVPLAFLFLSSQLREVYRR